MYQVKLEYFPDGDLSKKKVIGTLHMIPVGDSVRYRMYDENLKIVKQNQISNIPTSITPWQLLGQILT